MKLKRIIIGFALAMFGAILIGWIINYLGQTKQTIFLGGLISYWAILILNYMKKEEE